MQLVLVSGLSGSGKSIALNVLEDSGYYCVDNLPVKLLQETVQLLRDAGNVRVAMSIDARSGGSLALIPGYLRDLKAQNVDVRLLFLDCDDEVLQKLEAGMPLDADGKRRREALWKEIRGQPPPNNTHTKPGVSKCLRMWFNGRYSCVNRIKRRAS